MIVERNYNGSITISDIVNNQRVKKIYIDFTMKEAKRLFKEYLKTL